MPKSFTTANILQGLIRKAADQMAKPDARDIGLLARALTELEEMKRKLKMRPLPKSVDVTKLQRAKRSQAVEPGPIGE